MESTASSAPLAGRTALVTGASRGIGRAIARDLARRGARVWALARTGPALEQLAGECAAFGPPAGSVEPVAVDLSSDDALVGAAQRVAAGSAALDILVHNAGLLFDGPFERSSVDEFDALFRANVRAPFLLTQRMLPLLRRSEGGRIIFVNSTVGLRARAGVAQFAATQHALKALADALREEVANQGVSVTTVYPGRTATARQREIFAREGRAYRPELLIQPEDIAQVVADAAALPRGASVTDIAVRPNLKSY